MSSSFALRVGAIAGWLALAGILVVILIVPTAIAGQPVTATLDRPTIVAYFSHPEIAFLSGFVSAFVGMALLPFGLALRQLLEVDERSRFIAAMGLLFLVVTIVFYLLQGPLAAALVTAATQSSDVVPLFRFYDVLYNTTADVWEGLWVGSFSVAMLVASGPLSRRLGWFGAGLAVLLWAKAVAPFVALPAPISIASGVLFFAWFAAVNVGLGRAAFGQPRRLVSVPA